MADFSLDLNEDQLQIQKWVHDFAEDVIRPAAHEWDEREETPWPIIEEAAKIGLYSLEFVRQRVRRPDRPHVRRSSARSCAGATPASRSRSSAPRSRVSRHRRATARPSRSPSGCRSASARPRRSSSARSRVSEPDAGSDVSLAAHPRRLRRGQGRVGAQRHQDVDHQRRHRRRARGRRVGRARAEGPRPRELRRAARARPGCAMGQKFKKHGIRASHTAEVDPRRRARPRPLPARRQGEARRAPRPCHARARAAACRPR